jgi:hypothetical protein
MPPYFEGTFLQGKRPGSIPWIMVPSGERKTITLKEGKGYAKRDPSQDIELRTTGPDLAITVNGSKYPGTEGVLRLKKAGVSDISLGYLVLEPKIVATKFFLVEEEGGKNKTTRTESTLRSLASQVNDILKPQANIEIEPSFEPKPVRVTVRLDIAVPDAQYRDRITGELLARRDPQAAFNVFCLKKSPIHDAAETLPAHKLCVFLDNTSMDDAQALAHETGHLLLGREQFHEDRVPLRQAHPIVENDQNPCGHSAFDDELMYYQPLPEKRQLNMSAAYKMNQAAKSR